MRLYHTLGGQYLIHGKEFPKGTVVLQTDDGIEVFCRNFNNTARSRELLVHVYNPINKKWIRCMMKNAYTELMWNYYKKNKKKIDPRMRYPKKNSYKKNKEGTRAAVAVPDSVRWAIQHPYQGGGISPK